MILRRPHLSSFAPSLSTNQIGASNPPHRSQLLPGGVVAPEFLNSRYSKYAHNTISVVKRFSSLERIIYGAYGYFVVKDDIEPNYYVKYNYVINDTFNALKGFVGIYDTLLGIVT